MRVDRLGVVVSRLISLGIIGAMFALMPTTAWAATERPPSPKPRLLDARVIARAVASAPLTHDTAQTPMAPSKPFFKSRMGLLVVVTMVVGTGYALYSAKQDRVRGSNR